MKIYENSLIIKSIGGLYFVETPDGIYECKARGSFRNKEISPCCGDRVTIEVQKDSSCVITRIAERRNSIIRPPLSNLDMLVFVIATCEPKPNFQLLDKFIAIAQHKNIQPLVVFTKTDKSDSSEFEKLYNNAGICALSVNNITGEGCKKVLDLLCGKVVAFTGNTGVGKSSLINNIFGNLDLKTNEISKKLGRGKHTTRHVELYKYDENTYIADTPGFSSFDTLRYDVILKDELADCFIEFAEYEDECKFADCSHTKEKGCAVIEAVNEGKIAKSRHESYLLMYEESKQIKEWELK